MPEAVWRRHRTIIIHPGPEGDRGPSALDWAIMDAEPAWGVTARQATGDLDGGPVWGTRVFRMPSEPPRKSTLYNTEVSDAAMSLLAEVVAKAEAPGFTPRRQDRRAVTVRPLARQADRAFSWGDPTARILRRIRAADGHPGVHTELAGMPVAVFDAHPGEASAGEPGTIAARGRGAVLVRTGDGALWIGQARRLAPEAPGTTVKLPAVLALGDRVREVPVAAVPPGLREIGYRRVGRVGWLQFAFANGAMSTGQCRRLAAAVRHAAAQDTAVLDLAGGEVFANGIHLGVIDAHPDPAAEAWRNIIAIDDLCREIIGCIGQVVVAALAGDAGAGGVMPALGADEVIARDGVLLNPHYRRMGLYGSGYWTYLLPRRAGEDQARRLTTGCEPIAAAEAAELGIVDRLVGGDRAEFAGTVLDHATALTADAAALVRRKQAARDADEQRRPLETYRVRELAEMSQDIFDDRHGFAGARRAFLTGRAPGPAPEPEPPVLPVPRLPGMTPVG
ncbi:MULTISPECIES: enoyl-CoA hydratase-related protein [Amycolatopsis]|uniref:Formyl transferase n=1 Tax=Amycolatopsis bullii TaxID=941987 RepID=A0ABQ3JYH9_9PSEU|nr:enoyl-CoA hydratase-related protein [Amycolatopsis bullii]GHF91653.1 formyl transferase [Amycolatopsis bullii]